MVEDRSILQNIERSRELLGSLACNEANETKTSKPVALEVFLLQDLAFGFSEVENENDEG